jgi:protein-L-isoaspartate(D-aspartate) O-methyltransferase
VAEIEGVSDDQRAARERMVESQIAARGVDDRAVLEAMRTVPRHRFVPPRSRPLAHTDQALPLEEGQTISQPFVVARMAQLARIGRDHEVLEVGTGSGYAAAVLASIARRVVTVEVVPALARAAAGRLADLGYDNVVAVEGRWTETPECDGPFDAIVVAAGTADVPSSLEERLADGGRLVIPAGRHGSQRLVVVERRGDELRRTDHDPVAFVPLV